MANQHMKRCPILLAVREMKAIMEYHYIPIKLLKILKPIQKALVSYEPIYIKIIRTATNVKP